MTVTHKTKRKMSVIIVEVTLCLYICTCIYLYISTGLHTIYFSNCSSQKYLSFSLILKAIYTYIEYTCYNAYLLQSSNALITYDLKIHH